MNGDTLQSLLGTLIFFAIFVLIGFIGLRNKKRRAESAAQQLTRLIANKSQAIVKTYKGDQTEATKLFQADSIEMAAKGYFPTAQTWAPGQWGAGAFIGALLLCLILVGVVALIYMLIVKPEGALTATYELRTVPVQEKTCPMCAERIKEAA